MQGRSTANGTCVGACVGVRGSRIKNIVDELGGEKIDIVRWNDSIEVLIMNALKPAEISSMDLEFETKKAKVRGRIGVSVEGQEEKLPVIREIAALATPENLAFLPPDKRMAVAKAIPPADLRPFGAADLPESVRRYLTEVDGRIGTPVLVYPAGDLDVWDGRDVHGRHVVSGIYFVHLQTGEVRSTRKVILAK